MQDKDFTYQGLYPLLDRISLVNLKPATGMHDLIAVFDFQSTIPGDSGWEVELPYSRSTKAIDWESAGITTEPTIEAALEHAVQVCDGLDFASMNKEINQAFDSPFNRELRVEFETVLTETPSIVVARSWYDTVDGKLIKSPFSEYLRGQIAGPDQDAFALSLREATVAHQSIHSMKFDLDMGSRGFKYQSGGDKREHRNFYSFDAQTPSDLVALCAFEISDNFASTVMYCPPEARREMASVAEQLIATTDSFAQHLAKEHQEHLAEFHLGNALFNYGSGIRDAADGEDRWVPVAEAFVREAMLIEQGHSCGLNVWKEWINHAQSIQIEQPAQSVTTEGNPMQEDEVNPVLVEVVEIVSEPMDPLPPAVAARIRVNNQDYAVALDPENMRVDTNAFTEVDLPTEHIELIDQALDDYMQEHDISPALDEDSVQDLVKDLEAASGDEYKFQHFSGEQYELRSLKDDAWHFEARYNSLSQAHQSISEMITEHGQPSLHEALVSVRQAATEQGLDRPIGNPVNAAGEPADLCVPAELKELIDPPKHQHDDQPTIRR